MLFRSVIMCNVCIVCVCGFGQSVLQSATVSERCGVSSVRLGSGGGVCTRGPLVFFAAACIKLHVLICGVSCRCL